MAAAKFQSSRFRVRLESDDGDQRVTVVVGIEGLKIMNEGGTMTMRSLDLKHISRWADGRLAVGKRVCIRYQQNTRRWRARLCAAAGAAVPSVCVEGAQRGETLDAKAACALPAQPLLTRLNARCAPGGPRWDLAAW